MKHILFSKATLPIIFLLIASCLLPTVSIAQQKTMCTPPNIFPSSDVTICNGQSTTISVTDDGLNLPHTYLWSPSTGLSNPNISNPVASPTITTTYTVTVTDNQPCTSAPGFVTVTVNPTPTVTVSGTNEICNGQNTTLTASGASSYVWSPAASLSNPAISNPVANPTASTNYTVTGTGANGCTSTSTYSVIVDPPPTVTVTGNNAICVGQSTTLTAAGAATYVWSPAGSLSNAFISNPVANPTTSTNYTVTGTDVAGCTGTSTYSVTVNPTPTVSISGSNTLCSGSSTTLCASGGVTYLWDTGPTTACIVVSLTTTTSYTVTATDGNGCTDDDVITVTVSPLPDVAAGPDVSICLGSSTTLNAIGIGSGTYMWSPTGSLSNPAISNPVANPTTTTTYTVTFTNSCGSVNDSVTVTINASPSVNAGIDATICLGGSTTLNATGSGTYAWSPSSGLSNPSIANPVANPTVTTNYTVTVTDVCGTASDSVWVIIDVPVATISGTSPICNGSSTTLCATGGGTYAWSSGPTTSCITVSPAISTGYTVTITDSFGCTASATMTVSVNALPVAAISGNTTICTGVNDTLVATGGTGYLWNTGATTDTLIVSPTSATVYSVTVTDGNGCSNSTSFSVSVNPQPTANAGADVVICNGDNTTLNGIGTGTYLWNPGGQTIPTIVVNPTSTTTYTFSVTNSCGTADDSVVVNVNPLPAVAVNGNDTICLGSTDTLVATGGPAYLWNTGATTDTLIVNPTSATGYTVTVTDANSCSNTATFTVSVSSVTASITGTNAICSGDSTTLTASGGGTYSWNTGLTTTSITVSPPTSTSYTVTATNSFGCTDTATFNVTVTIQPTASVTATDSTICSGSSTTLTASGGSVYSWSTGQSGTAVIAVTPPTSTTYTVFVSNGACADTASISIAVNPSPTVTITASAASICLGDSATFTASGGGTYLWSTGETTTAIIESPASTGNYNYTVTATDVNGCTDNATILLNVLSPVVLLTSGDTSLCLGDVAVLTAQGGGTYTWNTVPVQTTSSITVSPTSTTNYIVTGSNGGCSDTDTINVNVYPVATAAATATPYSINIGTPTTLTGITSTGTYSWSWETSATPLSCATCQNPVANPTTTTTYTLCITDANGCTACDTVIVNVLIDSDWCEENLFVPSAFSPNADGKNDFVTVRSSCIETIDFIIYNRWGQIVYHTDDPGIVNKSNDGWDGMFNGKECDPAVYFYILNATLIPDGKFITEQGNVSLVR